jgi:hypothetical protein
MLAALERGTTIGRLRVCAAARDAAAVRMRSEAVLRDADLQPSSLPPHAILCIRSFADPLPGALDLDPRHPPSARWHEAARASIDAKARCAVRPAREAVPAAAEAVVFMDWAELLACAARDALRGELALGWWWRHLFAVHDGIAAVAHQLARQPRYVPAMIELLAQRRSEVVAFARAVSRNDSVRIVEAALRESDLAALAYAIVTALTATPAPMTPTTKAPPRAEAPPPALVRAAPEALDDAALPIEQRLLIAVPLLLRRAPTIVRAAPFQAALIEWIEPAKSPATKHEERPPQETTIATRAKRSDGTEAPHHDIKPALTLHEEQIVPERQLEVPPKATGNREPATGNQRPATRQPGSLATAQPATGNRQPATANQATEQPSNPATQQPPDLPPPRLQSAEEQIGETLPEISIASDFAGALFLINAGIALGFYGDFTTPLQRGIDLDIWQFVAHLARALAGAAIDDDPLTELLASLRGDEETAWIPPPVLAAYPGAPDDPLARWIGAVANHLRLRLGEKLARALVAQHGRITTTPAHLDAWFNLVKHPIEIRLTGLDRDPGWVPAAGRYVAFHFD